MLVFASAVDALDALVESADQLINRVITSSVNPSG
jgi:hypothetical protein